MQALACRVGHHSTFKDMESLINDSTKYCRLGEFENWKMAWNPVNGFREYDWCSERDEHETELQDE